jgi:Glycosyltransferase family 87
MSIKAPLGATPEGGAFDVTTAAALVEPARTLHRSRSRTRAERIGIGATLSVPVLALFLCMAGTRTGALVPATINLWPPSSAMAGPLEYIGINLAIGEVLAALLLLVAGYLVAIRYSEHVPARVTIWAIAAFTVIVLIGPPLFSTDVFSYQVYGKMFAVYHINPYVHGPSLIQGDPLYNYIGAKWINTPSVYGPLFTFLSSAFAKVSVAFSGFAFKLIAAAASAGTLLLIWKSAKRRGVDPARGIALFGLNPLVTLYGVGGGHNDLLMLLLTTGGVYAVLTRRDRSAGALFATGAAVKLTGALVLPFALLGEPGGLLRGRRHWLLVGAASVAAVVAAASYIAFGTSILHLTSTLQTVQDLGAWQSLPGFLFALTNVSVTHGVRIADDVVLVAALVWLLHRVWRGRMDWIEGAAWATFAVLATAWSLLPWYVCWMMPLVAISSSRRLWNVAVVATLMGSAIMIATCLPSWNWF